MLQSTFRQIEVFLEVVRTGSFAGAADSFSISSASVSNHIKALETRIGVPLFIRDRGRGVSLTEAGHRVHLRGTELMKQVALLAEELQPNRDARRRRLTLTSQRFLARTFLSGAVARFTMAHPSIELVVETGNFEDVLDAVANDRTDLGYVISSEGAPIPDSTIVGHERLGFFCAAGHPVLKRGPLRIADLGEWPFLVTRKDERFAHMVAVSMAEKGLSQVHVAAQIQDGTMIGEVTARGDCLMCGPALYVLDLVRAGRLVEVPTVEPPISLPIHQIVAPGSRAAREIAAFVEVLQAASQDD